VHSVILGQIVTQLQVAAAPEPAVLPEEPPQAVSRAEAPATAMTCTNCLRVIFMVFFLPYLVLSCSTITANRL